MNNSSFINCSTQYSIFSNINLESTEFNLENNKPEDDEYKNKGKDSPIENNKIKINNKT
jgi:hypothetical protein